MFDTIRAMVGQKQDFLETADLLLEENSELTLESFFAEDDDSLTGPITDDDDYDDEKGDDDMDDDTEVMDTPITSSPASSGDDTADLLSMTIDLRSNTSPDVLPVPPLNADDAVGDDSSASTRVADGFDDGELSIESVLTEAISVDGGDKKTKQDEEEPPAEEEEPPADDGSEDENSTVTDAVMDKVAESDAESLAADGDGVQSKIQDKLDKFQKDIMNLKDLVKKGLT